MRTAAILAAVALIAIAFVTTIEGPFVILFGWIPFLGRVLPEVKPDGPSVAVGGIALLVFATGVHWLGRSRRGRWRVRWTVAVVLGVLLLFTAGISVIGVTHQLAWLATSDQPIAGKGLNRSQRSTPERRAAEMWMVFLAPLNIQCLQVAIDDAGFAVTSERMVGSPSL